MVLEALGVFVLVVLILVGALLPLRYMARMHLPRPPEPPGGPGPAHDHEQADVPKPGIRDAG